MQQYPSEKVIETVFLKWRLSGLKRLVEIAEIVTQSFVISSWGMNEGEKIH